MYFAHEVMHSLSVLLASLGDIILGMAEGIPEGDEVRRIIINAKGEVKNVVPPVPEPQKESETPEKTSGSNTAETAAKIGAGIAVGEIGEALINQGAKAVRKAIWGKGDKRGGKAEEGTSKAESEPSERFRKTTEYYDKQEQEIRESIGKRPFMEIQSELVALAKSPNPTKESELKIERQKPLRVADEIGVIDKLKGHLLKIQATLPFNEARVAIARLDVESLENECTALFGWDEKLKGILGEYRDVALLYMDRAELLALGLENSGQVKHINDQLRVRAWGTPPVGLERMAKEYFESLKPNEGKSKTGKHDNDLLTEIRDLMTRSVLTAEQQNELLRRGYGGLIQILESNAPVDPRQNRMQLPPWYESQSPEFKDMLDFMMNVNYAAAIKRTTGAPDQVFDLKGSINLKSRDFEKIWKTLPGFREAMVTMVSDIFDPKYKERFVISRDGYKILNSELSFKEYREKLEKKIAILIQSNNREWATVYGENIESKFKVSNLEHAKAATSTAFNFLFLGGAFDSGDEQGSLNPGQSGVVSLPFRMLYMPGLRGKQKWIVERGKIEGVSEEDFGGRLGDFMRWNIVYTPGFQKKFEAGQINFIPKRLLYSLFEHERFSTLEKGGRGRFAGKGLAETLLTLSQETSSMTGVKSPDKEIIFSEMESGGDMFTSYIENSANYTLSLYNHLTSSDPKNRLTRDALTSLLIKIRKDSLLRKTALDEDFVMACIIMAASPNKGLVLGTEKTVLDLPEQIYEIALYNATNDSRMFEGMASGSRSRILKKLHHRGLFVEGNRKRATKSAQKNILKSLR